jgi:uncharacterized protein YbaP (TraB family)
MKFILNLTLTLSCFLFSVISFSQTAQPLPNTVLWRISGKGLKQPSYLFGTLHLKDRRVFNFTDSTYAAIENTDGFALELDPEKMSGDLINSFMTKDTSGFVKDELDKETYDRVRKKLESKFGSRIDRLTKRQLFLARHEWMNEISRPDDMQGFMDVYLYHIARQQGKWISGIEDIEDQMGLIDSEMNGALPDDLFPDIQNLKTSLNEMINIYLAGDINKIFQFAAGLDDEKRFELLNRRNQKMAFRIDSLLKHRTGFFAVGAAHLAGDTGLISLLQKIGYQVEPVFSSNKVKPEDYSIKSKKDFWKTFYSNDSSYSVRYPSGTGTLYMADQLVKMEMCMDLPTSTYFISASFPNLRVNENREKILEEMVKGFTQKGKVFEKKKLDLNGMKGLEVSVQNESFLKVQAFVSDAFVYMLVMGHDSKKEVLNGEFASQFFNSFKPTSQPPVTSLGWQEYRNKKLAFSIAFPGKPTAPKPELSDEWIVHNFKLLDNNSLVYFMVNVKSTAPGFYLAGDSNYFSLIKENWANTGFTNLKEEHFLMGEYAGMRYDMMRAEGKEKVITRTMTVNRGSRSYLLIVAAEKGNENNPAIDQFFQSFRLLDYSPSEWKIIQAPDQVYSAYVPGPITKKNSKKSEEDKDSWSYVAYDSSTAVSYEMQTITFVDYYYGNSDSAIFNDALVVLNSAGDSIIERKMTMNGAFKSQEVILNVEGSTLKRRMRLLLNGDTVYAVYAFLHPTLLHNTEVNKHFDDWLLMGQPVATELNQRKVKEYFDDLWSGDSLRFAKAANGLARIVFEKADIPQLKESLLKQYDYAEIDFSDIYNDLADELFNLKDSTAVLFINKNYFSVKLDNEAQRIAMLRLLTRIKTKESFSVLKDLLLSQPPNTSYLYPVKQFIADSLQLTANLFPDVMRLSNDSNYCEFTGVIANLLLDSNLINITSIKAYEKNLMEIAAFIYEKYKTGTEDNVQFYYPILRLLARFNTPDGNALLAKLVQLNNHQFNIYLIPELLNNKFAVSSSVMEETAADITTRFLFFRKMEEKNLQKQFPVKYQSQKMIAEADVHGMASGEYEVDEVVYLQTKKRIVNGESRVYYLFKVKTDEGIYLGISGGYSADSKIIGLNTSNDDGGIYWTDVFNSKKVDEQFEAFFAEKEMD